MVLQTSFSFLVLLSNSLTHTFFSSAAKTELFHAKNETPAISSSNYLTYRVPISEIENDIVFIKSLKSNRWWMKMPVELSKNRYMSQHLMPCSYKDYQQACTNEVPDRWWSAFHKLS